MSNESDPTDLDAAEQLADAILNREWHPGHLDAAGHTLKAFAAELRAARVSLTQAQADTLREAANEVHIESALANRAADARDVRQRRTVNRPPGDA